MNRMTAMKKRIKFNKSPDRKQKRNYGILIAGSIVADILFAWAYFTRNVVDIESVLIYMIFPLMYALIPIFFYTLSFIRRVVVDNDEIVSISGTLNPAKLNEYWINDNYLTGFRYRFHVSWIREVRIITDPAELRDIKRTLKFPLTNMWKFNDSAMVCIELKRALNQMTGISRHWGKYYFDKIYVDVDDNQYLKRYLEECMHRAEVMSISV